MTTGYRTPGELLQAGFAFDYDNLTLAPRVVSTLTHRADAAPGVRFGCAALEIPLIGSPMPDVCGTDMCRALGNSGALGVLHRFQPIEEQVAGYRAAVQEMVEGAQSAAAIGVTGDYQARFTALYATGCRIFCLDTANGAHEQSRRALEWVRSQAKDMFVMAGNVATAEAFRWLEDHGADAIRVGIAGGSVCETRTETGVFVPTPYAVAEAASVRQSALIVGDSGVRSPADACKLLALGADAVMVGSVLAGTREAPGRVLVVDGKKHKIMRGAASFSVQEEHGNHDPEYVEGAETIVPYKGGVADVLDRYLAGIRSSMSYLNAKNLTEYRGHASFLILH
jgi:IMP dehydrogenase